MFWEAVFLLVILKIPVVYLCLVVWWAIKSTPEPPQTATRVGVPDTPAPASWSPRRTSAGARGVDRGLAPRRPSPVRPVRARREVVR